MAEIRSYRDLKAWQKSMSLVEQTYRITAGFPAEERYGLSSQLRRAAVSIPSNIAEGFGRSTRGDYVRFLDIARGSLNEVETQFEIAARLGYLHEETFREAMKLAEETQRILHGVMRTVSTSKKLTYRD